MSAQTITLAPSSAATDPPNPPSQLARSLCWSGAIALIAVYWLGLGALGFFVSIAVGFCTYAALTLIAALRVRESLPAQVA